MINALGFLLLLGISLSPLMVAAQGIAPRPAGPNTLSGMVTDTLGQPIANADVLIAELRRRTRTASDGAFRFDSVKAGSYSVSARSIGYVARSYRVNVRDDGGSVYIRMIRIGISLPSMITTAERGGLSGIIGDTAYRAMAGVRVTVMGTSSTAFTDSAGAFFLALKPGRYMGRLDLEGHTRQLIGVTIPENEGRRIAAWMAPQFSASNAQEGANLFELNQRLMRMSPASSKYFSREDMERQGIADLQELARRWAVGPISPDCFVRVNGGPRQVALWELTAADLEFVEVYLPSNVGGAGTRGVTSINGMPTRMTTSTSVRPQSSRDCGNLGLIVWLRQ
jgi:hypothetical protein